MKLSKRLSFIASFVDNHMIIADIGSDHGYLPYYLLENKIINKAYACDNKIGPYQNLLSTFNNSSFDIEISLKDGLNNLPDYVNALIITGMGGDLIIKILKRNFKYLKNIEYLILSPHSHFLEVRKYLSSIGYKIIDEGIIKDDKFYQVIKYQKGNETLNKIELMFGPILLQKKNVDYLNFYQEELSSINKLLSLNLPNERKNELLTKKELIEKYGK